MTLNKKLKFALQKIKEYDTIYIFRHINPDGDAYGSSFGLKDLIKTNFPDKEVYCLGTQLTLQNIFPKPDEICEFKSNSLSIVCDTPIISRIDGTAFGISEDKLWSKSDYIIKIDHHPIVDKFEDLSIVKQNLVAATEIVGLFALVNNLKISQKASQYIFAGIVSDSNRFIYPGTNSELFNVVSKILRDDTDIISIYQKLYDRSISAIAQEKFLLSEIKYQKPGIGIIKLTQEQLKENSLTEKIRLTHASIMSNYNEIEIWIFATQANDSDQHYQMELRSKRQYNISNVARQYNGGGHETASAATTFSQEEFDCLVSDLSKLIKA